MTATQTRAGEANDNLTKALMISQPKANAPAAVTTKPPTCGSARSLHVLGSASGSITLRDKMSSCVASSTSVEDPAKPLSEFLDQASVRAARVLCPQTWGSFDGASS
jgi:hypothetical protein